jgi:hypothetical protein
MDDDWPEGSIPASAVEPCWLCESLEMWQSFTGQWHCLRCDPPLAAAAFRSFQKRAVASKPTEQTRRDAMIRDANRRVAEMFGEEEAA